jgi:hypothetical protein
MKSARRSALVLVALLVMALTPVAQAAIDYSKNSAGGDYAPAGASKPDAVAATDAGFEWGDAAIGAGVALVVVLLVTGMRSGRGTLRARREPA